MQKRPFWQPEPQKRAPDFQKNPNFRIKNPKTGFALVLSTAKHLKFP
jgi:hypothetical protein